ncbi:MAG: D-alanyl-D-alanine carboxypeptidase family protein [Arenibacterium sp.]
MIRFVQVLTAAALAAALSLPASAFETRAGSAFVLDYNTNTVLLEKNADVPLPPASMSKLMTLYMLFEAIRDVESVTLETRFTVSSRARAMGGSSMFLNEKDRPTALDLIRGIIVQSGNDATVVVAEGLAGSEAAFARQMSDRARSLGMTGSSFVNASGWPEAGHRMSMRDLAILAKRLIEDFPEHYPLFAETIFEYDGRVPSNHRNRNPLLTLGIGADGLKTGHTQEAGYGLVGSAKQGDRRVIFVISGLDTQAARAEEAAALVNWSFRQFAEKTVARAGQTITQANVWMGREQSVNLVPEKDHVILLPALGSEQVTAEVIYDDPVQAPVAQGQRIAELVIRPEGLPEMRLPLVAADTVPSGGFGVRVRTAAEQLLARFVNRASEPS